MDDRGHISPMKIVAVMRDLAGGSRLQKLLPYLGEWASVQNVFVDLTALPKAVNLARSFAPGRAEWGTRRKMNPYYFRTMSAHLARRIREQTGGDYDLILLFEALYSPGLGGERLTPYVIYDDCTAAASESRWPDWVPVTARTPVYRQHLREYYHGAAFILTSNELTRRSLVEDYDVPAARVARLGQGCDWVPDATPVQDPGPHILFVGFEFVRKGGPTLLKAFRQVRTKVPDARLTLVGPQVNLAEPGVSVVRPGYDKEAIRRLYQSAAVFVLPSVYDPMPNAALEAMAIGVPTVVSDGCGTVELVTDGTDAVVTPANDAVALAERLTKLLLEPGYRQAIGRAGAELVRRQPTWAQIAGRVREIAEGIVQQRRAGN